MKIATCAAVILAACVFAASAAEVTLQSPDGTLNLKGDLITSDGPDFTIRTAIGEISVPRTSVSCLGAGCPAEEIEIAEGIKIHGSDTVGADLMPLLVEGYANTLQGSVANRLDLGENLVWLTVNDDFGDGEALLNVEIQSGGSSTGFKDLIAGQTDIAMASRNAKGKEVREYAAVSGGDLRSLEQEYVIAVDSIMVVASPNNPVDKLSMGQLADIFSGRVNNWRDVGGLDAPITVYTRPEASGTRGVFETQVLKPSKASMSPGAMVRESNAEIADAVTEDPNAIGYVGFASVRGAKTIDLVSSCGIETPATAFTAKTEEYPLERRLRLFADGATKTDHERGLLEFAISQGADGLIRKAGFIDLGVQVDEAGLDELRLLSIAQESNDAYAMTLLRNMLLELKGASRLSTTFRFSPGSSILDNKAQRDIARLIEFLARPENAGRTAIVAGFTDADGAFGANADLSKGRAEVVMNVIRSHPDAERIADVQLTSTGYGELAPVACNDNFAGRKRNRRVEVWLR